MTKQPSGTSSKIMFDFKELCLICSKKLDRRHKKLVTASNDCSTKEELIELCEKNNSGDSLLIIERIKSVPSLVEAKAAYHNVCYDQLLQVMYSSNAKKQDSDYEAALQKVFSHIIESGKHQFTLQEFRDLLQEQFRSDEALCTALKEKFGNEISIVKARGKQPKFLYKKTDIAQICTNWHYDKDNVSDADKTALLKVAAEILKTEVKNRQYNYPAYPESSTFMDDVRNDIPPRLSFFLDSLLSSENDSDGMKNGIKRTFIAHSIISASRPKSFLSTLQLALGTYIHKKTGLKWIILLLSKLGISASYDEVQTYEASTTMDPVMFDVTNAFLQYVSDNTDHVNTSDNQETLLETPSSSTSVEQKQKRTRSNSSKNKRKKR